MEVWLCGYASVITEPNFHAFSQTCWGFGHPRKSTTCCTVLNCRPFDFFNFLKYVSRKSWSCWWSLTWIFVCYYSTAYKFLMRTEHTGYYLDYHFVVYFGHRSVQSGHLWHLLPTSCLSWFWHHQTLWNSTTLKDVNFVKLMRETAPTTFEAFCELQKDFF